MTSNINMAEAPPTPPVILNGHILVQDIDLQPLEPLPLPLLSLDGVRAKLMLKMCAREKSRDDKGPFAERCRVKFASSSAVI
jgi:hypothetical protein